MDREEGSAAPAQAAVPAPSLSTKEAGEALRELFLGALQPCQLGFTMCWPTAAGLQLACAMGPPRSQPGGA